MPTVSIRNVAEKAGVSRATVSRALNRETESLISPETRARVKQAAQELGYMPSMIARGLARRRMNTLGIVMTLGATSPNTSPHYAALFDSLVRSCRTHHQNVTLYVGEEWHDRETSLPYFRDGRCDGLLVYYQPGDTDLLDALADGGVPLVRVLDRRGHAGVAYVDIDHAGAMQTVTTAVLSAKHRRVCYAVEYEHLTFLEERLRGFRAAFGAAGVLPDTASIVYTGFKADAIATAFAQIFDAPPDTRPTAIIANNDSLAVAAIEAAQKHGLRVPEDVAVTGFNDDGTRSPVALSTLRLPYEAIGAAAVSLLLAQIGGKNEAERSIILPTELVLRDSFPGL